MLLDYTGIVKADVGVKDGRIVGVGKSGNPDIMDGVDPHMVIGAGTEVISGEGKILTAGEWTRTFILFVLSRWKLRFLQV